MKLVHHSGQMQVTLLGMGRWLDRRLDLVFVNPECAIDEWCTQAHFRPSQFRDKEDGSVLHWYLELRKEPFDGNYTNLGKYSANNSTGRVFQGATGSLLVVTPTSMNSTNLASFSSRGPAADGRIKPDIVAPGHTIYSAYSDGTKYSHQCGGEVGEPGSTVTTMSGTSMATPIAAGVAALARQYFEKGWLPLNGLSGHSLQPIAEPDEANSFNPSAALLRAVLINSAANMQGAVQVSLDYGSFPIPRAPSFYQGVTHALW